MPLDSSTTDAAKTTLNGAVDFVMEHSVVGENGKRNATRAAYFDFMKSRGVPAAQVKAVADAEGDYISAAVHVATGDLVARIGEAKKAGNDPSDLRSEVILPTSTGRITATVMAHSTARVPRTGETIVRHGAVKVQQVVGGALKRPAAEFARDAITAAMK